MLQNGLNGRTGPTISTTRYFIFFLIILGSFLKASGLTQIQNSTSIGYFKDYYKSNHFPLYHSWTITGLYEKGIETDFEFYVNNDFAENTWLVIPTQLQVSLPLSHEEISQSTPISKVKFGRQLYSEGFDFALIDGILIPYHVSENFGFLPVAGYLRSTDFEQPGDNSSPLVGLILWHQFHQVNFRGGMTSRETDLSQRYIHGALQYQFEDLWWQPAIYHKEEFKADGFTFNQSYSELLLHLSSKLDGRIAYSNLDPRPTNKIDRQNFIYRIFTITPTETVMTDLTWTYSENLITSISAEKGFYNSGYQEEKTDRQDLAVDLSLGHGKWITPCITHLKSYGGELTDFCLRYSSEISAESRYMTEINSAYVKKINQIEGWVEHFRGSYETNIFKRTKLLLALEAERNQYFIFDVRSMAYVTNYL